jgi:hypothetical protein
VGLDGPNVTWRRGSAVKTFSKWIENKPKEKCCILFDKGWVRYGIKGTYFTKVYNTDLHGARALPLVGIIEFFLYRTMKYFLERANAAHTAMENIQMVYSTKMTEFLKKLHKNALLHRAERVPLKCALSAEVQWKFEVQCKAKAQKGQQKNQATYYPWGNNTCKFSCQKPQLLHTPCRHVIAACYAAKGLHWDRYMSRYFFKQTILYTWNRIVEALKATSILVPSLYIPDPNLETCQGIGRRKKMMIRNSMNEGEAGPSVQLCSKCNNPGHSYKKCTTTSYYPNTSTNDVATPSASGSGRGHGHGHHTSRYNQGVQ